MRTRAVGRKHRIGSLSVALLAATFVAAPPAHADYDPPSRPLETQSIDTWLLDQARGALEPRAKAVTTELLTTVGQGLLNGFIPTLGDLIFGGGAAQAGEDQTKVILDRLDELEQTLSGELAQLADELHDQQEVDIRTVMRNADDRIIPFFADTTFTGRYAMRRRVCDSANDYNVVRVEIEEYVGATAGDPAAQLRRLRLLPTHITATQLSITTNALCVHFEALEAEHLAAGSPMDFNRFVESLSRADLAAMEQRHPGAQAHADNLRNQVIAFYDRIASEPWIDQYVDERITPHVSDIARFQPSLTRWDDPAVVTNPDSWGTSRPACESAPPYCSPGDTSRPILDGVRHYYYVNVPRPECLDHNAYDDLTVHDTDPWQELPGDPAASNCNRFWLVEPFNASTNMPNLMLGSFDGYSVWFTQPEDVMATHRELVKGDLLLTVFGPVSLILDEMFARMHPGEARPANAWDAALDGYDRLRAQLGVADNRDDGRTIWEIRNREAELGACGVDANTLNAEVWFQLLNGSVHLQTTEGTCELFHDDPDGDLVGTAVELFGSHTDPTVADTDGDGLTDGLELWVTTDPLQADSDGDGLSDSVELLGWFTNPKAVDTDGDGLADNTEVERGLNARQADSDGDNVDDDRELQRGTDPLRPDTDDDGLNDNQEFFFSSDPLNPDSDGDGMNDGPEVSADRSPTASDVIHSLRVVEAASWKVNEVFSTTGTIYVDDTTAPILLPGMTGIGRLQSRHAVGQPGAPGAGLHLTEWRVSLSGTGGSAGTPCVEGLVVPFPGSFVPHDFAGDGAVADVFVITRGTVGSVTVASAVLFRGNLEIMFDGPVCPGQTSFAVGLAAPGAPRFTTASLLLTSGEPVEVAARTPGPG